MKRLADPLLRSPWGDKVSNTCSGGGRYTFVQKPKKERNTYQGLIFHSSKITVSKLRWEVNSFSSVRLSSSVNKFCVGCLDPFACLSTLSVILVQPFAVARPCFEEEASCVETVVSFHLFLFRFLLPASEATSTGSFIVQKSSEIHSSIRLSVPT